MFSNLVGDALSPHYPYIADKESQESLKNNEPVLMKSCWNGAVVINSEPFLKVIHHSIVIMKHGVTFRASVMSDRCDISECELICKDLDYLGYSRIYMNPNAKVTLLKIQ